MNSYSEAINSVCEVCATYDSEFSYSEMEYALFADVNDDFFHNAYNVHGLDKTDAILFGAFLYTADQETIDALIKEYQ